MFNAIDKRYVALNTTIGVKTGDGYEFYLKRNCSISPSQLAAVFIFLGTISVFIGIVFYSLGATLILPFSCLEVLALMTAFFYNAIHANDYELLRVDQQNIYFESNFMFLFFPPQINYIMSSEEIMLIFLKSFLT